MQAYAYPQSRHRRTLTPGPYVTYRSYKPALREEFKKRCVYCCEADEFKGLDTFGVDHYRPRTLFPLLAASYDNLFYACNTCNRLKGWFWPSSAQLKAKQFIPNPCDHVMATHLRFVGERVVARTVAGRFTRDLLLLNEERAMLFRYARMRLIADHIREDQSISRDIRTLERRLAKKGLEEDVAFRLTTQVGRLNEALAKVRQRLNFVRG